MRHREDGADPFRDQGILRGVVAAIAGDDLHLVNTRRHRRRVPLEVLLLQIVVHQHPGLPALLAEIEAVRQLILVGVGRGPVDLELRGLSSVVGVEVGHVERC